MDDPKDSKLNNGRPLPPVETRWKPGQSGNPKGRPRKGSIVDLLEELVNADCPIDPERRSYGELLMRSLLQLGLKGNLGAIREISNRLVGQARFLVERVGEVPTERDRRSARNGPSGPQILSLADKNELLQSLGIEPISEQPDDDGLDAKPSGE